MYANCLSSFRYWLCKIGLTAFLTSACAFAEEPWGRDADLHARPIVIDATPYTHHLPLAEMLIAFHQEVISPADGPRSHFKPSSSQYTLEAMRKYGFFCGYVLGCDRLMRENSEMWIYPTCAGDYRGTFLKYNPVP